MTVRYVEIVRVSTVGQADRDTPQLQRVALDRLRLSRPGLLVERIEAPGVSGAMPFAQRPDLRRLAELTGKYDEVRVYAIDRLTRADDPRERFAMFGLVADAGAKIVEVSGRVIDPTDEMGEIDYYLQTLFASRERRKIAQRSRDGMRRKAAAGRLASGRPPFGRTFDKVKGTWGIDQEKVTTYRRIFSLCLKGLSIRHICDALNGEGRASRGGGPWCWSVVGQLLRDRSAIGEWHSHGCAIQVPSVVDPATFEAVQKRLRANRWEGAGPKVQFHGALLRKLIGCGVCGRTMYVRRGGTRVDHARYYQCGATRELRQDPQCRKMHLVASVDAAVKTWVTAFLDRPGTLQAAAFVDRSDEYAAELRDAQRAVSRLDKEEERLARLGRRKLISERVMAQQSEELAALRVAALARLDRAQGASAAAKNAAALSDQMEARIALLRRRITRATTEEWRELIEMLFPRAPGIGLVLHPSGQIEGRGGLSLEDSGSDLRKAASFARSKLSGSSTGDGQTGALHLQLSTAIPGRSRGP